MTPCQELTADERSEIIGAHKCHNSIRTIAKNLGHSKSTIQDTIKRFKETGSLHPDIHPGWPKLLSTHDKRALNRIVAKNHNDPRAVITEKLEDMIGTTISMKTTAKYLNELGWKSCFKCKKPLLTESHAKARLSWCHEHAGWDWKNVIFNDESRFAMYKADGGERVWGKSNEKYHKDCIASTLKFGGGSVMF